MKLRHLIGALFGTVVAATLAFAATTTLTLGTSTGPGGILTLFGSTSGSVTVQTAAAAGTGTLFQLPATNGSATNVLVTDGSGVTSWAAAAGGTTTIASNATAMGTSAISSATCATAVTATATGAATTDTIIASFNADPTAVTGYIPATAGMLTIIPWVTLNTANFKVCNNTTSSITPGAVTINWRIVR